jgi:hypothetical protein
MHCHGCKEGFGLPLQWDCIDTPERVEALENADVDAVVIDTATP